VGFVGASAFYCTVKESGEIQHLETTELENVRPSDPAFGVTPDLTCP